MKPHPTLKYSLLSLVLAWSLIRSVLFSPVALAAGAEPVQPSMLAPQEGTSVIFPGASPVSATLAQDTHIQASVPDGAVDGDIHVQTENGTSNAAPFGVGASDLPLTSHATITATGQILADTIWDQDVLVTGDIQIPSGITLTLAAGVTVAFAPGDDQAAGKWSDKTEITVLGTLRAEGTPPAPVAFVSANPTPAAGDWGGIVIREGSTTSVLKYSIIQHATYGLYFWRAGSSGNYSLSATLSNSGMQFNEYGLVTHVTPPYPGGGTSDVTAILLGNHIHHNTVAGLQFEAATGYGIIHNASVVQDNLIEANPTGISLSANSWWNGHVDVHPEIHNNTLRDNSDFGINLLAYGSSDVSDSDTVMAPSIEHNLFLNPGATDISMELHPLGSDGSQTLSPVIRYNTIADAELGILIDDDENFNTLDPAIDHNIFYGCDTFAIHNLTTRPINAEENYWGSTEAEWDLGAGQAVTGTVSSANFLDASSAPILTRVAPDTAHAGTTIDLYGANFAAPTVIFSDSLSVAPSTSGLLQLSVLLPNGAVAGDVVVSAADGSSNGLYFTPVAAEPFVVSGLITANTVWDQDVLVTGDIEIRSGITLTIKAGVTVAFAPGDERVAGYWGDKTEIMVLGTLRAEGTPTAPIYFTSSRFAPAAGDWGGIVIRESSTTSVLKYTVIQYASRGLYFCRPGSISGTHSFSALLSNSVLQANQYGIFAYITPEYPASGISTLTANILSNHIQHNTLAGIRFEAAAGYGTIYNHAIVENNLIEANPTGIYLGADSWWNGHVEVYPEIRNNTLRDNGEFGLYFLANGSGDTTPSDTNVHPLIEHNLIQNVGATDIALRLDPMGGQGSQILNPVIRYNTIADADLGILISDVESGGSLAPVIDHNIFYGFEMYAIQNLTARSIGAEENYWGSTEAEWELGAGEGVTGPVVTTHFLNLYSNPIVTRLAPGWAQEGDSIHLYGANFHPSQHVYRVFLPLVVQQQGQK